MNELITIPQESALTVFTTENGLDPYLQEIEREVKAFEPDVTTTKGRKEIASIAHKVAKSKTALDNIGKELVAELKKKPKLIDAERKRVRDFLDKLKTEVREPLTKYEEAEAARIEKHKQNIELIRSYRELSEPVDSVTLQEMIDAVKAFEISESWEEFELDAQREKEASLSALIIKLDERKKYEAEQVELARLRAEQEERERKEREARIAQEAAEKAKIEAEAKAKAEQEKAEREALELKLKIERAEREKIEAEEAAKRAAIEAEQRLKREAEEAKRREQEELERREANTRHKGKINRQAAQALQTISGIDEALSKEIIKLIAKNEVPNVRINY